MMLILIPRLISNVLRLINLKKLKKKKKKIVYKQISLTPTIFI